MMPNAESQLATSVMMIRPVRFESNPMTAASNAFQADVDASPARQQEVALEEFESLASALREAGVEVIVFDDTREPHSPDSVFPNNWITFHADGRVVLYPMEAPNRRVERRTDVLDRLVEEYGFRISEVIDLSPHENRGEFLEGTGSMVLDRVNHIAYACLSSRTHLEVLGEFAQRFDYDIVAFEAVDRDGVPIYHTNVMMNLGEKLAVVCEDAIARDEQREAVRRSLAASGHRLVAITREQLESFAGNMLELRAGDGARVIAMSRKAWDSLDPAQQATLEADARIVAPPIGAIELAGGGSVRCMLAEIHLPRQEAAP